jgi:hypothetical protein
MTDAEIRILFAIACIAVLWLLYLVQSLPRGAEVFTASSCAEARRALGPGGGIPIRAVLCAQWLPGGGFWDLVAAARLCAEFITIIVCCRRPMVAALIAPLLSSGTAAIREKCSLHDGLSNIAQPCPMQAAAQFAVGACGQVGSSPDLRARQVFSRLKGLYEFRNLEGVFIVGRAPNDATGVSSVLSDTYQADQVSVTSSGEHEARVRISLLVGDFGAPP